MSREGISPTNSFASWRRGGILSPKGEPRVNLRTLPSLLAGTAGALILLTGLETASWAATSDPAVSDTRIEAATNTLIVNGRRLTSMAGAGLSAVSLVAGGTTAQLHLDLVTPSEIDATLPDTFPASKLTPGQYAVMLTYGRQAISSTVDFNRTFILFTFVTNQTGFDTAMVISNVGQDSLGHTGPAGTCTISWFGSAAPPPTTTPSITAGTNYATLASGNAPGFSGYAVAACNFKAAADAFVIDIGATRVSFEAPVFTASSSLSLPWLK